MNYYGHLESCSTIWELISPTCSSVVLVNGYQMYTVIETLETEMWDYEKMQEPCWTIIRLYENKVDNGDQTAVQAMPELLQEGSFLEN